MDGKNILKIIGNPKYVSFLKSLLRENSISQAARDSDISYRKAWDIVEELRDFFGNEIIQTRIGGSGGGGTYLTSAGIQIVKYLIGINENFTKEMERFLHGEHLDLLIALLQRSRLRTSARNQLFGTITDIQKREVTSLIKVDVNGIPFKVLITNKSVVELGLRENVEVYLLIKAPQVQINPGNHNCENFFTGKVLKTLAEQGENEGYCEVEISIDGKLTLTSISKEKKNLTPGDLVNVCVPAREIIIGV